MSLFTTPHDRSPRQFSARHFAAHRLTAAALLRSLVCAALCTVLPGAPGLRAQFVPNLPVIQPHLPLIQPQLPLPLPLPLPGLSESPVTPPAEPPPEEVPTDEPLGGCFELNEDHTQGDQPVVVAFGSVRVSAARTVDDEWIPLRIDDCDGDGDLDVRVPSSEGDLARPALIHLRGACGDRVPRWVTLIVQTDGTTFHAIDARGNPVDTVSVSGSREPVELNLYGADGITGIRAEGLEFCLLEVCWSCEDAVDSEEVLVLVEESEAELIDVLRRDRPRFVRGDTAGDGSLDLTDARRILGHLFLGVNQITCMAAADSDDSGDIDLSDATLILGHLFLGGDAPASPYPGCGTDPTFDELSCDSGVACP